MKKRTNLAKLVDRFYVWCKTTKFCITETRSAKKHLKLISGGYNGTRKEFNDVVVRYWKKYGVKPKKFWYDLYCYNMNHYDPRFIPDTIWFGKILPYYNNLLFMRAYTDKGILDLLYPDVKQPETVIKNISGIFYDKNWSILSEQEAINLCAMHEKLIFKPSIDSGAGRLIEFYDSSLNKKSDLVDYFDRFNSGFIVQELVEQHETLSNIHKNSLNTVRVISFYFENKVYILSSQLRMGSGDSKIDNYSAGGYACNINSDGTLSSTAVSKYSEDSEYHPSGIAFKDIKVPSYHKLLKTVENLHKKTPYYNLIGWDFGISREGDPVLLEFNVTQGQNQLGSRVPTFLDLTEEVLEDVFIKKSLKDLKN